MGRDNAKHLHAIWFPIVSIGVRGHSGPAYGLGEARVLGERDGRLDDPGPLGGGRSALFLYLEHGQFALGWARQPVLRAGPQSR
jgi:hypothetical protein